MADWAAFIVSAFLEAEISERRVRSASRRSRHAL